MEELLAAKSISQKGAHHDTPSATHDRRHAGAKSFAAHANFLRATGFPVRTPLPQIPGKAGARGDPHLSGLPHQRKETGAWLCSHRGRRFALSLQSLAEKAMAFR